MRLLELYRWERWVLLFFGAANLLIIPLVNDLSARISHALFGLIWIGVAIFSKRK